MRRENAASSAHTCRSVRCRRLCVIPSRHEERHSILSRLILTCIRGCLFCQQHLVASRATMTTSLKWHMWWLCFHSVSLTNYLTVQSSLRCAVHIDRIRRPMNCTTVVRRTLYVYAVEQGEIIISKCQQQQHAREIAMC